MMAALSSAVMVIHDQTASRPREFT